MQTYKQRNKNMWFPNLIDDVLNHNLVPATSLNIPAVNIMEYENRFEIDLAIPGKKKEDFTLEIEEDVLIINFNESTTSHEEMEKGKYTRKEFNYSSFRRTFAIPENVNQDDIKVSYVDGILKFELPKRIEEPQKEKKSLSIA
jgi:Molecular chaperone (small heat shock protein)